MNVVCPLCKGPAVQPIMDIYCKNECQKGSTISIATSPDRVINHLGKIYHIYKKPPPLFYKDSVNAHGWLNKKFTDTDDITREIDAYGSWKTFRQQGDTPWNGHHYHSWQLVLIP